MQSAEPYPDNNTPKKRNRNTYSPCPNCGTLKISRSEMCRECYTVKRHNLKELKKTDRTLGGFRKGHAKHDWCPICGDEKNSVSEHCLSCAIKSRQTIVSDEIFYTDGDPCRWLGLTLGQKAIVDADLYDFLSKFNWHAQPSNSGYYGRRSDKTTKSIITLHDQVMGFPSEIGDHANRNPLDARRRNLRPCEGWQNRGNSKKPRGGKSRYKGVCYDPRTNRWRVYITIRGVRISGGYFKFEDEELAGRVADQIYITFLGEFAVLNFPDSK